jgi:hypothetical protein
MFRTNEMPNFSRPLPAVKAQSLSSSMSLDPNAAWHNAKRWTVATAKRVLPVILAMVIFTTIIVAVIAIKLAAWLPIYLH